MRRLNLHGQHRLGRRLGFHLGEEVHSRRDFRYHQVGSPGRMSLRSTWTPATPFTYLNAQPRGTEQANTSRLCTDDYTNSGFSRGHMAPNFAIMTRDGEDAQRASFVIDGEARRGIR